MQMYLLLTLFMFKASFAFTVPKPTNLSTVRNLYEHKIVSGVNVVTSGNVLFDCVKYDCGASVLVCTNGVDNCFFNCAGYGRCDGYELYSAAKGRTEFYCQAKDACVGTLMNCGIVRYRGQDGFRRYPGYDKENVAGIRDNSLFEGRYGKCSVWCGNVGCKEAHLECNGDWQQGCHLYAGSKPDAFWGGIIGARLARRTNVARLYCGSALACQGLSVDFHCLHGNDCKCIGGKKACKGVKVKQFPLVEIPPTAKCQKSQHANVTQFASCRDNFECNVFCKTFTCHKCSKFDCNGDDACAGTRDRGLNLTLIKMNGDPQYGLELGCNGDRTCMNQGGKNSVGFHLPKHQRGFQGTNVARVICSGDNSCEGSLFNMTALKGGVNWECGDNACLYSEIHVDWINRLNCAAQNTCAFTNFTAGVISNFWDVNCGQDACNSANFKFKMHPKVSIIKGIFCAGEDSCKNFKLHISAVNPVVIEKLECANQGSCHGARFSSTGPVKWPKVACGGRRGPCKDFKINGRYVVPPTPKPTAAPIKPTKHVPGPKTPVH